MSVSTASAAGRNDNTGVEPGYRVAVPIVIFAACLAVGAWAASRWLPSLASGMVGGLAFLAVCGLIGAALALVGVHVYLIVRAAERNFGTERAEIVAQGLTLLLWEAGSLLGFAWAVYLLAPKRGAARATSEQVGTSRPES
jgi:hypothetical protein